MKQSNMLFVLGEFLTIGGIDYCNGFAVSRDVQSLLNYKKEIPGSDNFKIGVIIGKEINRLWYGDRIETVNPVMIIATNE